MNSCCFVGRLASDPEKREYSWGYNVLFTLAVNRPYKDKDGKNKADFLKFKSNLPHVANYINEYCKKGDLVSITSSCQQFTYEKDGKKNNLYEFNVQNIKVIQTRRAEMKARETYIKSNEELENIRAPKILQDEIEKKLNQGMEDFNNGELTENTPF